LNIVQKENFLSTLTSFAYPNDGITKLFPFLDGYGEELLWYGMNMPEATLSLSSRL
jgi:hypothetical protein